MNFSRTNILLLLVVASAAFYFCSKKNDPTDPPATSNDAFKTAMLTDYADQIPRSSRPLQREITILNHPSSTTASRVFRLWITCCLHPTPSRNFRVRKLRAEPMKTWLPAKSHLPLIGPFMYDEWVAYLFSWFGAGYDLFIVFFCSIAAPARLPTYSCLFFTGPPPCFSQPSGCFLT